MTKNQNIIKIRFIYNNSLILVLNITMKQQSELQNLARYPITKIDKQQWNKKVNCTLMYTIPAQDEALPVLIQLQQILQRLISLPLAQTLAQQAVEYFFVQVFPPVCQKIIKSRYFKNQTVLKKANKVLQLSVCLLPIFVDLLDTIPQFIQIIYSVFPADQFYFKTNNQMDYRSNPYLYFQKPKNQFQNTLKPEDKVDIIKFANSNQKMSWSQGTILQIDEQCIKIKYDLDWDQTQIKIQRNSYLIAPYKTQSTTFQWRKTIKVGDLIDSLDSFGGWYNATVLAVNQKQGGKRQLQITFKVYNQNGTKTDQKGKFYGFAQYNESVDAFSSKVQPYCSVAKQFCFESSKSQFDVVDDCNDMEINQINGKTIYAFPRKKQLSQLIFEALNSFGYLGGFQKVIKKIQEKNDIGMLSFYVKGLSGVASYLHKRVVIQQIQKLKKMLQANLFKQQNPKNVYTKQKSEMLFTGFRALLKRLYNSQVAYEYENNLKIQLVNNCFKHESLKRKLHGLNQLKQIVKSLTYGSNRNKKIISWIKQNKIFQKIYLVNSHVQLIKKSQSFFRYIINQGILQVEDLQKLLKMAQKGDYETRISLYSLFKQVSHIFKKNHVDFMIDKILQTEPHLILNQDIDLLHELAKYSNYFPTKKVMAFFQNLILGQGIALQLNSYAIKKYGQMISKNYEMKPYRKQVIQDLLLKLKTHDISKISKILKQIFEGIGVGEWGKKDLGQLLIQQKFDQVIVDAIQHSKENEKKILIAQESMGLLLNIYKLCSTFKIQVKILEKIWKIISDCQKSRQHFFKWANTVLKCEQGIQIQDQDDFQKMIGNLFKDQNISKSNIEQFQLFKSLFTQINKRKKYLTVSNIIREKQIEKEYRRKAPLKALYFYKKLRNFIYESESSGVSENAMAFFITLYSSSENSQGQVEQFLTQNIEFLKNHISQQINFQACQKLNQTLKIISLIIDDSQKLASVKIDSLLSKKKNYTIKLKIINQVSYSSDSIKSMQVTLPINSTLFELREHLAKQLSVNWQAIRIVAKKQLTINQNCRTLKELNIDPSETITINRKAIPSQPQGEIIIDGQLNPKAIRVFQVIFGMYSTDGLMNKTQCYQFTIKCLGPASSQKYYNEKIDGLYSEYNQAKDDMLKFSQFLKFYKNSATSRSSTVWSNLRSFGVQGNFKFSYEPSQQIKYQNLPRVIMSKNHQVYDILFRLIKQKSLVSDAFQLLQRLPISKKVQEQILSIQKQEFDFQKIFNIEDLYIFFYKLNVIQYLLTSQILQTQEQQNWKARFIASKGHDKLNDLLFNFIDNFSHDKSSKIQKQIIDILIGLIYDYSFHCYFSHQVAHCVAIFQSDFDIDDKLEYIVTGQFPKKQMTLKIQEQSPEVYDILSASQSQISDRLVCLLEKLWIELKTQTNTFITDSLVSKSLSLLSILLVNQNLANIVSKIKIFNMNSTNIRNMRKIYLLIMCVCFNSNEGQKAVINQMFNNLTMENIISEHFAILAVLVSKYGISEVQEDSMSDILMMNILKSDNQLTIQGCAMLLQNFNLSNVKQEKFNQLWNDCLFGLDRKCKKQQTREAIYRLILKISQNNLQLTNFIIKKVSSTILQCLQHMRITSCVEDNQRSLNGYAGLKNLGNICYINSMMQQLYMNKKFRYLILRIDDNQGENIVQHKQKHYDDNILHQLKKVFAYLQLTTRADYVPDGFCFAYKPFGEPVNIMMQQDVQEFVSMFFDQLQNKIKETPFKRILDTFYGGKSTNLFACHQCNQIKKRQQNFYSITLQVKNSKTLAQSFNRHILGQLISDFHCDFCNKKVDVSKKTRISKPPKTLLIHLQRMVFNLDTFINQKITTRHEFPMDLNLYQYSLAEFEKNKDITAEQEKLIKDSMNYQLKGIICHIGNAESGHYISYIKIQENKWLQFNDSLISTFSPSSIEAQCFGGNISAYMDQFQWDRASQSSKSAYILLYQKQGQTNFQLVLKDLTKKGELLKELCLNEVLQKLQENKKEQSQNIQKREQAKSSSSQDQDETALQDQMLKLEEQQKIRKKSRDLELELEIELQFQKDKMLKKMSKQGEVQKGQQLQLTVKIDQYIQQFIPLALKRQILNDNNIHFFEKCLASKGFVIFFSKLLQQKHSLHDQIFELLKKLTFGFWIKSPQFKQLLKACSSFIDFDSKYADKIIFENMSLITTLIQYSDLEVRSSLANFLANSLSSIIQKNKLSLNKENSLDLKIQMYLDNLFNLIPTTVSKAWTKFNQYFQFWAQFSQKGDVQLKYMIKIQVLKHFLDYYLDKKSPLKLYKNKPQIGSKYANPNFANLLKTVTYMLGKILQSEQLKLSKDDYTLLVHYDCMEKLISQNYEGLASQLVKGLCRNNLYTSQKLAIILLKGLNKATFNNVQPYLDVLQNFVLIQDKYQDLRIKWVLGKPVLLINPTLKYISAFHGFSFDQRIYTYHSAISIQQGASLLDPIFQLHKRAQNFAMMSLRSALKLCLYSDHLLNYIWNLPPPLLIYSRYIDFFSYFIDKYLQQCQRSHNYNQNGFNKQQLGKQVKQLYQKTCEKWNLLNSQKLILQQSLTKQKIQPKIKQQELVVNQQKQRQNVQQHQSGEQDLLKFDQESQTKGVYFPVQFKFIQKQKSQSNGLKITYHQSELTMLMLHPTGKGNASFSTGGMQKNIDKILKHVWKTAKIQMIKGFFVYNDTRDLLRLKTDDGSQLVKSGDSCWIWAQKIQKVFVCERTSEWPKWSLYDMQNQEQKKDVQIK